MSSELAIAAVTAILRDLLQNRMVDAVAAAGTDVVVTAQAPNRIATDESEKSSLNLFMYRVSPNQGWRNVGLPAFNSAGERRANPPLALDLHYLITAYGAEDLHTDILLGYAMHLLHETPVLTRAMIQRAFPSPLTVDQEPDTGSGDPVPDLGSDLPPILQKLRAADLADQVESIRITPESLSTEEMARLWTAFQAPYRPTAIYQASVVLIERERPISTPKPVLQRAITVEQIRRPVITDVLPASRSDRMIVPNDRVVVRGRELAAEQVAVLVDGAPLDAALIAETSPARIELSLPGNLPAGVHGMHVVHPWLLGVPAIPHGGIQSDVASFVLHPVVARDATGQYDIGVEELTVPHATSPPVRVTHVAPRLVPAVTARQQVELELLKASDGSVAYVAIAGPRGATTERVTFAVPDVRQDTYWVRVRVDGAESPLDRDEQDQVGPAIVAGTL